MPLLHDDSAAVITTKLTIPAAVGIPTSGGLERRSRELQRIPRTDESLTVALIDVDGLDAVNREAQAGDALLQGIAGSVKQVLRRSSFVARVGANQFVCVIYGQTPSNLSERFVQIGVEVAERHGGARITVSFGHARNQDRPELVARAEDAMSTHRDRAAVSQRGAGGGAA